MKNKIKRLGLIVAMLSVVSMSGCKGIHRLLGTEKQEDHKPQTFVVACCHDTVGGIAIYPSFVPDSHVQLCQQAESAGRNNQLINGDVYIASHVDCGKWGYKIGDSYYEGKGY